ncbi:MAG: hypothetical protein M3680_10955 [Myxococcota bacterium]|nr:hypothetical protein [Myxococcota bacterium]
MTRIVIGVVNVLVLAACGDLGGGDPDAAPPVDVLRDAPAGCTPPEDLAAIRLTVSGSVRDLATGAPIVGATVDVAKAWTPRGFPASDCPALATLTTDAAGRFGPLEILAGPGGGIISSPHYLVFLVTAAGVASTSSDVRYHCSSACTLPDHPIAVPSEALATSWRTELAAGGMPDAATRGLVAFTFKERDGAPAAGVEVLGRAHLFPGALERGTQLRYVAEDGSLAPVAQATTLARGLAVIGLDPENHGIYVSGIRGDETWGATGSIVAPGWIFVEDRTVTVPPP